MKIYAFYFCYLYYIIYIVYKKKSATTVHAYLQSTTNALALFIHVLYYYSKSFYA